MQKRHFYIGIVNSEMPGDSKNTFSRWEDVCSPFNPTTSVLIQKRHPYFGYHTQTWQSPLALQSCTRHLADCSFCSRMVAAAGVQDWSG